MERFVRAIIVAAACITTAWWLLRDSQEQVGLSASTSTSSGEGVISSRASYAHGNGVEVAAPLAEVPAATPADGDEVRTVGASVAVEPIPLIEGITLPGGMWNLHTAMEREARDVPWADEMERQFSTYFASKPELGRNFGSPSVVCRTRSCVIQVIGYGTEPFATWSAATQDLRDQPWAVELSAGGIYTTARAPNEQAVVLILMRTRRVFRAGAPPPR